MAKRRRLTPPSPEGLRRAPEVKGYVNSWADTRSAAKAPIADVAGEAATHAAFQEVAEELASARAEGRLIQSLPISAVETGHLVRDRMVLDDEDMQTLVDSLAARGQQTPIEVVALDQGRYGLISGLRRVEALRRIGAETVQVLVRAPQGASEAYVAMVEENEVRVGLSFYERARLAVEAHRIGVYPSVQAAVQALFASAAAPKRSKILNFVSLYSKLDSVLSFPAAIPERLGLALVKAMDADPAVAVCLRDALRKTPAANAAAERAALERALRKVPSPSAARPTKPPQPVVPGVFVRTGKGRVVLSGDRVDANLLADLKKWLAARG